MWRWSSFNEWYMVLLSRPASKCYSAKIKTLWGNLDDHEFWDSMVFGHVSYPKFFTKKCWWNFRIHPIWNLIIQIERMYRTEEVSTCLLKFISRFKQIYVIGIYCQKQRPCQFIQCLLNFLTWSWRNNLDQ